MDKEEQDVIYAAIIWYKEVMRSREKLSPAETKLFYSVITLENTKVTKFPESELYSEMETTPAPSIIIDELLEQSKRNPDGD